MKNRAKLTIIMKLYCFGVIPVISYFGAAKIEKLSDMLRNSL